MSQVAGTRSEGRCMGSSEMAGRGEGPPLLWPPGWRSWGQTESGPFEGQGGGQGGMSSVCFKDTEGAGLLQTAGAELAVRSVNSDSGTLLLCGRSYCHGWWGAHMGEQRSRRRGERCCRSLRWPQSSVPLLISLPGLFLEQLFSVCRLCLLSIVQDFFSPPPPPPPTFIVPRVLLSLGHTVTYF